MKRIIVTDKLVSDFWARVKRGRKDECWVWDIRLTADGYGRIWSAHPRNAYLVHRVSWAIHFSDTDKCVCHKCDNPPCVNPNHLFIGTHQDNMTDKAAKGRVVSRFGTANNKTKLTTEKVRYIRSSSLTHAELGRKFNVTAEAIGAVRAGNSWGWLR